MIDIEYPEILFIAPNLYYENEAWSLKLRDLSSYLDAMVLTSGNIPGIYGTDENYVIVKNSILYYWIFALLTYFYSKKSKLCFIEITPYTVYFTLLVG